MTCAQRHLVDDHFAHRTDETSERSLREHLEGCVECKAWYERHLLFGKLTGENPARDRLMRPFGFGRARPTWGRLLVPIAAAAALILTATVVFSRTDGFTPRGDGASGVGIDVFRIVEGSKSSRVGASIKPTDSLAFAYQNAAGKKWLMIFAVDASKRVYWYHPAWERAEETPQAVPIVADAQWHELPDAVSQPLPAGRLELRAFFLDTRLDVKQLEASLDRVPAGAIEVHKTLEVAP